MVNKIVYSHWSKPAGREFVGFNSEKMLAATTYLSVRYSLRWFDEVELVTDQAGKELLVDKYKIPYTSVRTDLDQINHINPIHWAYGKLIACQLQDKPFMHQDNDVIWFKRPPSYILEAQSCFQNIENDSGLHSFYQGMMQHAKQNFNKKKDFINYDTLESLNCGIMVFNDLTAINPWVEHAKEYIEYYDANYDYLKTIFNLSSIIFEQLHLNWFLKHYGYDIKVIDDHFKGWVHPDYATKIGYTHLIGDSKRHKMVEDKILNRVKQEFPKFYKTLR